MGPKRCTSARDEEMKTAEMKCLKTVNKILRGKDTVVT